MKILDADLINQFRKVLRFKPGDRIILCDGKLNEVLVEISELKKDYIDTKIIKAWQNKNEPERQVILYCSILKRDNFEWIVQKATEVGVKEIAPIVTERTIKLNFKEERLKKIIREAAEQSGRGIVPTFHGAVNFEKAIEVARKNDINLFFDSSGASFEVACQRLARDKTGVFIGPEGGWREKEIKLARSIKNFKIVSLGELTLRAETVAVIGTYLACNF